MENAIQKKINFHPVKYGKAVISPEAKLFNGVNLLANLLLGLLLLDLGQEVFDNLRN